MFFLFLIFPEINAHLTTIRTYLNTHLSERLLYMEKSSTYAHSAQYFIVIRLTKVHHHELDIHSCDGNTALVVLKGLSHVNQWFRSNLINDDIIFMVGTDYDVYIE